MYAIRIPGEVPRHANDALSAYARLEYRKEDVAWVVASARAAKAASRSRARSGWFRRRARPTHTPVACKGSPRNAALEAATSA